MPNFASEVAGISLDFEAIPDLQPKAIRGILRVQRLPEENVLRNAIATIPVSDKLFKARIDDMITQAMTPEVNINADDPMVSDTWRWRSDQVHEYRQWLCHCQRYRGEYRRRRKRYHIFRPMQAP